MKFATGFVLGFAAMLAWHKRGNEFVAWLFERGAPDGAGVTAKRPTLDRLGYGVMDLSNITAGTMKGFEK